MSGAVSTAEVAVAAGWEVGDGGLRGWEKMTWRLGSEDVFIFL